MKQTNLAKHILLEFLAFVIPPSHLQLILGPEKPNIEAYQHKPLKSSTHERNLIKYERNTMKLPWKDSSLSPITVNDISGIAANKIKLFHHII